MTTVYFIRGGREITGLVLTSRVFMHYIIKMQELSLTMVIAGHDNI